MSDIVWQDPPPKKARESGTSKWWPLVDQLKNHPGKWAIVFEDGPRNTDMSARTALTRWGCEYTSRSVGELFSGYARWPEDKA